MFLLSEKEFNSKMEKIRLQNESKQRKLELKQERKKYNTFNIKMPSTSKLIVLVVFLMCFEIIIFSQYAMLVLGDTSALYALIAVPAALIPTVMGYFSKSKAENTANGITYETTMEKLRHSSNEEIYG